MNGTLSSCECRFSGRDTMRWWGQLKPNLCKRICFNFLNWHAAGMQKLWVQLLTSLPLLASKPPPSLAPEPPL